MSSPIPSSTPGRLFAGSSEMHLRMSDFDWSQTPVGEVENWPQSLKSVVKTLLSSQFSMVLTWGPDFTQFYNDAYSKLIGDKHPAALGGDIRVTLAESWRVLGPMSAEVMRSGLANWTPALPLLLERAGFREEAYFSVSHSPVEADDGQIVGTLAIFSEVTSQVLGERRLRLLGELSSAGAACSDAEKAGRALIEATAHALDVPLALLFRAEPVARLRLLSATGLDDSLLMGLETVETVELAAATESQSWKARLHDAVGRAARGETTELNGLAAALEKPAGLWNDRVNAARVMPLGKAETGELCDVLVLGISPNHAPDEALISFHTLLCEQMEAVLQNAASRGARSQLLVAESLRWPAVAPALETAAKNGPAPSDLTGADESRVNELMADESMVSASPPSMPLSRVLVVDDAAVMRDYVRSCLGKAYQIRVASSGLEALEMARREVPDLILCDVMMPGLSGFGLLESLRADPLTSEVPLIFLSSHAGSQARAEALDRGAQGYLVKPFSASELRERVEACLRVGRKRREQAHRQVEEILESITDAFYALDGEFRFTYVNRQTESFFAKKREELLGKVVWEEFPAACNTEFETNYRAVMNGRQATHFEALSPVFHRWIDVNVYPSARGISVYFRDVSERHRAQVERERLLREAQDSSRVKDEFLAIVSHELRTPLNAILGWSNLIASGGLEEADQLRGLETIERSARAQAQIIEDILDVSRIVTGKMRLEVRPMPLQPALEAAIEVIRPAAVAKGISIDFEMEESLGLVAGDASRLQQVFWNLLSNAVKFTPTKGRIWVGARLRSADVEIAISDSGRGIAPDFLPHVFERFRQGDMSSTREVGGLGLGLSIVRQIVELHGGGIEAQSEGVGQGATFFVSLPRLQNRSPNRAARVQTRAEGAQNTPQDGWRSAHARGLQGTRVLVVDDERGAREVVAMLLRRGGAEVDFAASSVEAMSAFAKVEFDLIVSDIAMPGGDGYELIGKLRRAAISQGRLPVLAVALTAYTHLDDRQRALDAGFQEHIAKPINPDEFLRTISTLLGTL